MSLKCARTNCSEPMARARSPNLPYTPWFSTSAGCGVAVAAIGILLMSASNSANLHRPADDDDEEEEEEERPADAKSYRLLPIMCELSASNAAT